MMTPDKTQRTAGMTTRQKVMAGVFAVILIIIIWQIYGLFVGPSAPPESPTPVSPVAGPGAPGMRPPQNVPQPAALPRPPQPAVTSQREVEIMKAQQEAEVRYINSLNQLQLLKVERDIAEVNKAIATARLETITAQKGVVDLLKPPPPITPAGYGQGLVTPTATSPTGMPTPLPAQQMTTTTTTTVEANYTVISVSQLQNRWNAVLGFQGALYSVNIGDILPADGSRVTGIDRSGVYLQKDGTKRKISLVPII